MSEPDVVRRSQLITPASSVDLIAKALGAGCDSLILDLEDAIAPSKKAQARENLIEALSKGGNSRPPEVGVRINGLLTPWCLDDLLSLQNLPIDTVVVPKIHCAQDLLVFDQLLQMIEMRGGAKGLTLQAIVESARGVEAAMSISLASPRCRCLIFGVGDYMADTGVDWDSGLVLAARARVANAAAAAGLSAMDHVHPLIDDAEGIENAARCARELGFAGKWAIHPKQLAAIHAGFTPKPQRVEKSKRIVQAYEAALIEGRGAISFDGVLVDEASVKVARRDIALAARLGHRI